MKLLYPAFLFALISLVIPVIIHLFNFRKYKRIEFTNIRFLREVKKETYARNKLKHILVLCSRMLALSFLIMAFAQPYFPENGRKAIKGKRALSIYIDNSFSMDGLSGGNRIFDRARQAAIDLVNSCRSTDVISLTTNDNKGTQGHFVNQMEANKLLDRMALSPIVHNMSEIVIRQRDALDDLRVEAKEIFLISDFQRSITDLEQITTDSSSHINLIPFSPEQTANLFIDSCWFETPFRQLKQAEKLHIRIRNNSDAAVHNLPIKLLVNGKQKALGSSSVEAHSYADTALYFTILQPGLQLCHVEITDYPVTFDDQYFFSYDITDQIRVLNITGQDSTPYIQALFSKDEHINIRHTNISVLDYSLIPKSNFIVVNSLRHISSGLVNELTGFVQDGGSLLFIPPVRADLDNCNALLTQLDAEPFISFDTNNTEVIDIRWEDPLFTNVFKQKPDNINLPVISSHYKQNRRIRSTATSLLEMQNGDPLLSKIFFGKGVVYALSVPLDDAYSNFQKHALFVPCIYNMALQSVYSGQLAYTIGKEQSVHFNEKNIRSGSIYHIVSINGLIDFIPGITRTENESILQLHNRITKAGNYVILQERDTVGSLSFNYDRQESDLQSYHANELQSIIDKRHKGLISVWSADFQKGTADFTHIHKETSLWKLCIIFTLIFLAIEILLIKYWKT